MDRYFWPAHFATTTGDKIRYEPQPFKNTVGLLGRTRELSELEFES